jgi:hypothetical protein
MVQAQLPQLNNPVLQNVPDISEGISRIGQTIGNSIIDISNYRDKMEEQKTAQLMQNIGNADITSLYKPAHQMKMAELLTDNIKKVLEIYSKYRGERVPFSEQIKIQSTWKNLYGQIAGAKKVEDMATQANDYMIKHPYDVDVKATTAMIHWANENVAFPDKPFKFTDGKFVSTTEDDPDAIIPGLLGENPFIIPGEINYAKEAKEVGFGLGDKQTVSKQVPTGKVYPSGEKEYRTQTYATNATDDQATMFNYLKTDPSTYSGRKTIVNTLNRMPESERGKYYNDFYNEMKDNPDNIVKYLGKVPDNWGIMLQSGMFGLMNDPIIKGTMDRYAVAKNKIPEVQHILEGSKTTVQQPNQGEQKKEKLLPGEPTVYQYKDDQGNITTNNIYAFPGYDQKKIKHTAIINGKPISGKDVYVKGVSEDGKNLIMETVEPSYKLGMDGLMDVYVGNNKLNDNTDVKIEKNGEPTNYNVNSLRRYLTEHQDEVKDFKVVQGTNKFDIQAKGDKEPQTIVENITTGTQETMKTLDPSVYKWYTDKFGKVKATRSKTTPPKIKNDKVEYYKRIVDSNGSDFKNENTRKKEVDKAKQWLAKNINQVEDDPNFKGDMVQQNGVSYKWNKSTKQYEELK